ncbi:MAG: hypothetical protein J7L22_10795 [Candidatus Marinimicrobia bacterium]|nr:hypothetical protein [Candidatus Neomarinimicrobiota bacterium]RKY56530.1 MAG: hypothetical protein DRP96_11150 [Candidatus Neomarinimicrobiota bacterium]
MRNKNRLSLLIVLLTAVFMLPVNLAANTKYYSSVQNICNAYQVPTDYDHMNLITTGDGKEEFTMTMRSARNQFDRMMLIGFYAAGKAMVYHNEPIRKVTIIVSIEYKETENIVASADRDNIMKFVNGEITSSEFVRRITFE